MLQPFSAHQPKPGSSRFSKILPPPPQLPAPPPQQSRPLRSTASLTSTSSHQLPLLPKSLLDFPLPPPPPPSHRQPQLDQSTPPQPPAKSPPLPVPGAFPLDNTLPVQSSKPMSIPRRPVGGAGTTMLSPLPEPSPTASISSLISAYAHSYDSPTTSTSSGFAETPPANNARDTSPPRATPPAGIKFVNSTSPTHDRSLPPPPPAKDMANDQQVPPAVPSKSEIWRRRPQNDSRELSGLKLDHSHGSTVSAGSSITSSSTVSTVSTQRPTTAIQDDPSTTSHAVPRKPPPAGGLPGRNIRPGHAKDASKSSTSSAKPTTNLMGTNYNNNKSMTSLQSQNGTRLPAVNRPPTPEYQKGEARAPLVTTFNKPASPASSPESLNRFSNGSTKDLPPPPPPTKETNTTSTTVLPKLSTAPSLTMSNEIRRKPTPTGASVISALNSTTFLNSTSTLNPTTTLNQTSAPNQPKPQISLNASPFSSNPSLASRTPTTSDSAPSDQSRGSSVSPTRQPMRASEQTPRQQRQPPSDPRIVQTEQGPMYRGRDGTLYREMTKQNEPDPRALYFPTMKDRDLNANVSAEGVFAARELKDSHYSCFQHHSTMNRRTNGRYPLTCQTCNKADADDRWACTFCFLRICEPCFRVLDSNQRDLKKLVADVGRRTPLSLSSASRPATAFGL